MTALSSKRILLLLNLLLIILPGILYPLRAQIHFTENTGQWDEAVLFRADIPGGRLYLESSALVFVLNEPIEHLPANGKSDSVFRSQHFRMQFIGVELDSMHVHGHRTIPGYSNFFIGNDPERWQSEVLSYEVVHFQHLYPGIDFYIFGGPVLKTEFHVESGADPSRIQYEIQGLVQPILRDGDLWIQSAINDLIESDPVAFQKQGKDSLSVSCHFQLTGRIVSYQLGPFDKGHDLVIDPYLVFSTYSGSTADNWGFTASFDSEGNAFSGGIVAGDGYPVSAGAFDINFQSGGNWDIGIIKYDSIGQNRIWATYIGGSDCEMPHSLIADSEDNLLILGTTGSSDFPTLFNAYDGSFNGGTPVNYLNINFQNGTDIFVFKLSANGSSMLGGTYIGGSMNDGLNYRSSYAPFNYTGMGGLYYNYGDGARGEIMVDENNQVYVGSTSFSDNFPVSNAFQPLSNGMQEGVVFSLTANLSQLLWSSYIGGSDDDAVYSIDVDAQGNIFFAGGSSSSDLLVTDALFPSSQLGGTSDGFLGKIQAGGQNLLHLSTYGSTEYDQIYFVKVDDAGGIFITGQTEAPGNTLIYNAAYNQPNSGQFIAKILPDFSAFEWSTVFGLGDGDPDIALTAFAVDLFDKIYLSGWGRLGLTNTSSSWAGFQGIKDLEVTPGAYQTESDGQDFYLMILSDDGNCLKYATFFGEQHYASCGSSGRDHVDGGTSRFDKRGYIYQSVCSSCGGCQEFPTYPAGQVWSETNNSSNCNNALFKFEMESVPYLPDVHLCEGESAQVGPATADSSTVYSWSPATLVSNPTTPNPWLQNITSDTLLTLFLIKGPCVDSVLQRVYFHEINHQINLSDTTFQCDYDSVWLQVTPSPMVETTWLSWSPVYDSLIAFPDTQAWLSPDHPSWFYVLSFDAYCQAEDSFYFDVPLFSAGLESELNPCNLDSIQLGPENLISGVNYSWEPAHLLSNAEVANPWVEIDGQQEFQLAMENQSCFDTLYQTLIPHYLSYLLPDSVHACDYDTLWVEATPIEGTAWVEWYGNAALSQLLASDTLAISQMPAQAQYYYFQAENSYCLVEDSVYINRIAVSVDLPEQLFLCAGDTLMVNFLDPFSSSDLQIHWIPESMILSGQGTIEPLVWIQTPGYLYLETSEAFCYAKDSIRIEFSDWSLSTQEMIEKPEDSLYRNQVIWIEPMLPPNLSVSWYPQDYLEMNDLSAIQISPQDHQWYFISGTDAWGCVRNDSIFIWVLEVLCDEDHVFVPSAFSPNGDKRNDVLFVRTAMSDDLYFAVYNRWGEKVFETTDSSIGWDGTFKGELQPPGVFVYHLISRCWDGTRFEKKGNVTLLR